MARANDLISCSDEDLRAHCSFFVVFCIFFVVFWIVRVKGMLWPGPMTSFLVLTRT